jgi:hypothetical protein
MQNHIKHGSGVDIENYVKTSNLVDQQHTSEEVVYGKLSAFNIVLKTRLVI